MKRSILCLIFIAVSGSIFAQDNKAARIAFVSEYLRELVIVKEIQENAKAESKEKDANPLIDGIRNSARIKLALGYSIATLNDLKLGESDARGRDLIVGLYKEKIEAHDLLIELAKKFTGKPDPSVDYGELATQAPQITALLEGIDETLTTKGTPAAFAALVDTKEDSRGHVSHLIVTRAERDKMLEDINASFGKQIDKKLERYPYPLGAAWLLRSYLRKFKTADDAW